mmetsp:Transcript_66855/g.168849  ORF Transcript_66855/g.168849 Transcript_66855/m.168849 type:complete len:325 (+) Transcript_66855:699-1673(+)
MRAAPWPLRVHGHLRDQVHLRAPLGRGAAYLRRRRARVRLRPRVDEGGDLLDRGVAEDVDGGEVDLQLLLDRKGQGTDEERRAPQLEKVRVDADARLLKGLLPDPLHHLFPLVARADVVGVHDLEQPGQAAGVHGTAAAVSPRQAGQGHGDQRDFPIVPCALDLADQFLRVDAFGGDASTEALIVANLCRGRLFDSHACANIKQPAPQRVDVDADHADVRNRSLQRSSLGRAIRQEGARHFWHAVNHRPLPEVLQAEALGELHAKGFVRVVLRQVRHQHKHLRPLGEREGLLAPLLHAPQADTGLALDGHDSNADAFLEHLMRH